MKFSAMLKVIQRLHKQEKPGLQTRPVSREELRKAAKTFSDKYGSVIKDLSRE